MGVTHGFVGCAGCEDETITPCCLGSLGHHRRIRGDANVVDAGFHPLGRINWYVILVVAYLYLYPSSWTVFHPTPAMEASQDTRSTQAVRGCAVCHDVATETEPALRTRPVGVIGFLVGWPTANAYPNHRRWANA